jgi:hypothetical protein
MCNFACKNARRVRQLLNITGKHVNKIHNFYKQLQYNVQSLEKLKLSLCIKFN